MWHFQYEERKCTVSPCGVLSEKILAQDTESTSSAERPRCMCCLLIRIHPAQATDSLSRKKARSSNLQSCSGAFGLSICVPCPQAACRRRAISTSLIFYSNGPSQTPS